MRRAIDHFKVFVLLSLARGGVIPALAAKEEVSLLDNGSEIAPFSLPTARRVLKEALDKCCLAGMVSTLIPNQPPLPNQGGTWDADVMVHADILKSNNLIFYSAILSSRKTGFESPASPHSQIRVFILWVLDHGFRA